MKQTVFRPFYSIIRPRSKKKRQKIDKSCLTSICCCYEYDRILERFKKKYPKIKVANVLGAGGQLSARVLAERRGEKYLPDVFSAGANTIGHVLYKAQALESIKLQKIQPPRRTTHAGSTFLKTTSILTTGWSRGKNILT